MLPRSQIPTPSRRVLVHKIAVACLAVLPSIAFADSVRIITGPVPSANELARMMFPDKTASNDVRTRSYTTHNGRTVAAPPSRSQPSSRSDSDTIGFLIEFDFGSAQIVPASRAYIDKMGDMLKLPELARQRIVIEGHTDSVGSAPYNRTLSEHRAAAVKAYLTNHHGIAPQRLVVRGMGESAPLPNTVASDGINRRVQFRRARSAD